ncbi:MAG: hypothetical protein P4L90_26015 [Rhodopila sp.]|nr:hypothetical protein [Rhodopila sp.]
MGLRDHHRRSGPDPRCLEDELNATAPDWVTPERVLLLVRMRASRRHWRSIVAAIHALDGPKVPLDDLQAYCRRHSVVPCDAVERAHRAAKMRAAKAAKRAASTEGAEIVFILRQMHDQTAVPIQDTGPDCIAVSFEIAKAFADGEGIRFTSWDDLPAINHARELAGLVRLARDFGKR